MVLLLHTLEPDKTKTQIPGNGKSFKLISKVKVKLSFFSLKMEFTTASWLFLATTWILLGIVYSDAALSSPATLLICLVFTLVTTLGFWIYAGKDCARNRNYRREVPNRYPEIVKSKTSDLNAGGIFVFRRGPSSRIEILHLIKGNVSRGFPWRNDPKHVIESVTNTCGIKPEELKLLPNFSIDIVHTETDLQGTTNKKMVTYWLAEVHPDTKVSKNARWLPYSEALILAASDPILEKVLTSCKSEIEAGSEELGSSGVQPLEHADEQSLTCLGTYPYCSR